MEGGRERGGAAWAQKDAEMARKQMKTNENKQKTRTKDGRGNDKIRAMKGKGDNRTGGYD